MAATAYHKCRTTSIISSDKYIRIFTFLQIVVEDLNTPLSLFSIHQNGSVVYRDGELTPQMMWRQYISPLLNFEEVQPNTGASASTHKSA